MKKIAMKTLSMFDVLVGTRRLVKYMGMHYKKANGRWLSEELSSARFLVVRTGSWGFSHGNSTYAC